MVKAFIFGKFLPFHKGHEAMIRFGLKNCDFLSILICCSDREDIPCTTRKLWIEKTFQNIPNFEILTFNYSESEFPNTSISNYDVSKIWTEALKKFFPNYSKVITSETYGKYVADLMNIDHLDYDLERKTFSVSASAIRKNLFKYWNYLPDSVKPYFSIKVVISGTESTGKTTLTMDLAKHFNCSYVLEAGRDIIKNSNCFTYEDLLLVAKEQNKSIHQAEIGDSPLIIIDTDINTTKSYSRFFLKTKLEIKTISKADLYLFLKNDVEFIQDGTRINKRERDLLSESHLNILNLNKVSYVEVDGQWDERLQKSIKTIEVLKNRLTPIKIKKVL